MIDYLQQYGPTFQKKVISNLLLPLGHNDSGLIAQVIDVLNPDIFETDAHKEIIKIIINYYHKYKQPPTPAVFKVEIEKLDSLMKMVILDSLKDIYENIKSPDLKYVRDQFVDFVEVQMVKNAVLKSVDYIKAGNMKDVIKDIQSALNIRQRTSDVGHIYEDQIEERLIKNPRKNIIPFGWNVLDEITDGGMGAGDLFTLVGSGGSGKSWLLTNIGLNALKRGKNVLHFTLELNDLYCGMRYDSCLCGIPSQNLKDDVDFVKAKILTDIKGKLRIQYYPTKTATVSTLRAHINKMKLMGFNPDLVIIDYADLLTSEDTQSVARGSYYESGNMYEVLRGMAGELGIPILTVSQARRSAMENEIITGDDVAESYKKVMTSDFVMSLSRTLEDKAAKTARFHIIKNRYGIDGLTFPGKMDASIGAIEMFIPESNGGKAATKDKKDGNALIRKQLSNKFEQFSKYTDKKDTSVEGFE